MQSKQLKSTCEEIQEHDTELCICQGSLVISDLLEPCDVPCNSVMARFSETMRYKQNE